MGIDTFNNRGDMVKHPNGEWVKASYAIMLETQLATANARIERLRAEVAFSRQMIGLEGVGWSRNESARAERYGATVDQTNRNHDLDTPGVPPHA